MRSLLVALDDTPASLAAIDAALSLATKHGASVTGAAIVDVAYLTPPEPSGIGTAYYKFQVDTARLKRGHERAERLAEEFRRRCAGRNVNGDAVVLDGAPRQALSDAAASHDLIVIGHDSNFHDEPGDERARTAARLLRDTPRPLLVTPAVAHAPSRIVVAYDGSVPAARTLQIFTLLGLGSACEVHVISVNPTAGAAERWAGEAASYLRLYDAACSARAITSAADPAELVMTGVQALGADLLVMGAYGRRGWRATLLGSFTRRLLSECPTTLFVHC